MPSRPGAPPGGCSKSGLCTQTSSWLPPRFNLRISGASESVTNKDPSGPTTRSLHIAGLPGSSALTLPSPEVKSKPLTKLPGTELGPGTPDEEKSFEHTQSMFAFPSTKTPSIDRVPNAAGLIHGSTVPVSGFTRQTPPHRQAAYIQSVVRPGGDALRIGTVGRQRDFALLGTCRESERENAHQSECEDVRHPKPVRCHGLLAFVQIGGSIAD